MNQRLVRVMASDARKARIAIAPAAAFFKAVRLETYVRGASGSHFVDVVPGAMASATKIHECNGMQAPRIEDSQATQIFLLCIHQADMFGARAMTRFTLYSGRQV